MYLEYVQSQIREGVMFSQAQVAEYVASLTEDLARIAAEADLKELAYILNMATMKALDYSA